MDLPVRKKLPHTIPQWVAAGSWFFITINCMPPGKNQLCRAQTGDAVLAAIEIQPRAIRLALPPLSACAGSSARHYCVPARTRNANEPSRTGRSSSGNHGMDWQRDFFDHRLRDHHELEEKTSYVLMNPLRKELCERAEDWVWVYRPNDRPPPLLE